ncbi:MAG: NAD-dependent epimerase/dehydratase family protein [Candidatus Sungbacteria bacterium]|nr:NAD-dependent epimerase/dehydratase family protein [Candidatus Sungbacteria bacterium]
MGKTILVTGCAGFIGSSFVKHVRRAEPDIAIVGIDDFSTGRKDAIDASVTLYEGSILDEKLLEKIFSGHKPAYVFHFAALPRVSYSLQYPYRTTDVNITGTVALLEAARVHGVKRFIYSSSSSVYGDAKSMPVRESENTPDPRSPYALQKYTAERFCRVFSDIYGLDTVCLRYFTVFGPGQYGDSPYATVISAWLEAIYFPESKKAFLEGDGTQSRDFCYIDNVTLANILAMRSEKSFRGDVFNIAHGQTTALRDIKVLIEQKTGKRLDMEQRPPRVGDVSRTWADISKAKDMLGYAPEVSFEDGLARTVAWFESRKS